jgi:glc operon protein GlcG
MKLARRKRVATAQTSVHKGVGHYGPPITLDQAKKAMAAAEAKAMQNNWNVAISIVDSSGHAVMLHRLDGTQLASIRIAEGKARTAVEFRQSTKALEDVIAGGGTGLRYFTVRGVMLIEGGVPTVVDGKIVGGIGVSGVDAKDDSQIAQAGADAIK